MDSEKSDDKKPFVEILMSTYNGEKYLREQLDSIFAQEAVEINLVVRDDGSTDKTLEILSEYDGINVIRGSNIGCEESFKELLYMPNEADYFAFADQDDIWHPRKLISAIENIQANDCDLSVCNLMIADEKMNLVRPMFDKNDIDLLDYRFKNVVIGNLHGCTQVWSNRLHKIIQSFVPSVTFPHDLWVNSIANMVSATYIDSRCFINYRIHDNNTGGLARNNYQRIVKGFKRYVFSDRPTMDILSSQLLIGYKDFLNSEDDKYKILSLISKYKKNLYSRFKLFFSDMVNKTDFQHRLLYWICILFNRY